MPEDFDIDSLARYLHLTPIQVSKMVERGKLPGRRIGDQWKFSQAEIHHWLEDRIGATEDDEELQQVEDVLQRSDNMPLREFSIAGMLPPEAIAIPLQARTSNSVINAMTELAAGTGLLWDPEKMAEAVKAREQLHPTALDNGVALLHPRRPQTAILSEAFLALGRTYQGIPFGGSRGVLTDIFLLICSTNDRDHLRVLARLSRLIADPEVLEGLRASEDPAEVRKLLAESEAKLE